MSPVSATAAPVAAGAHDHDTAYATVLTAMQAHFDASLAAADKVPLFTTDASGLFDLYLAQLPAQERQYHTCHACRRFIETYGGLVCIDADGTTRAAMWPSNLDNVYADALRAMAAAVAAAKVTGVFLSADRVWGTPKTGPWTHFAVMPPAGLRFQNRATRTAGQVMAERREDYRTMVTALREFELPVIETAVTLLRSDALYRSEKVLGAAEWLRDVQTTWQGEKNQRHRANRLWQAVALAPAGFCHPRTSMIGTLLEDIGAGMAFTDVAKKFAVKMRPTRYQRPQAPPSAGNIAQAERIVADLGIAASLHRRYARLDEIEAVWKPQTASTAASRDSVFGHLLPKPKDSRQLGDLPTQPITWTKFARTVLPEATQIEVRVPSGRASFGALVTAADPTAPPILQWDTESRRNPVSWYVHASGSVASTWGLSAGAYATVTAIALRPSMWHGVELPQHGNGIAILIDGARDSLWEMGVGNGLFPEILKADLHAVRATIEAYSRAATISGYDEASAGGLLLGDAEWPKTILRVTASGVVARYELDRWD